MAIQAYEEAIALNPDKGVIFNNMGLSYSMAGKHEKAIAAFKRALETKYEQSKLFNNLGLALFRAGRYQDALEALQKGGDEAQAYNNLGSMYLGQGTYGKAIECFEKALVLRPAFYDKANENLRKCRIAQGNIMPYQVKKGDNPVSIARSHNMKYNDFMRLNNLDAKSTIYPKQVVLIRSR
jgi:tetratricopeptide (TPR) repeat protein